MCSSAFTTMCKPEDTVLFLDTVYPSPRLSLFLNILPFSPFENRVSHWPGAHHLPGQQACLCLPRIGTKLRLTCLQCNFFVCLFVLLQLSYVLSLQPIILKQKQKCCPSYSTPHKLICLHPKPCPLPCQVCVGGCS